MEAEDGAMQMQLPRETNSEFFPGYQHVFPSPK